MAEHVRALAGLLVREGHATPHAGRLLVALAEEHEERASTAGGA